MSVSLAQTPSLASLSANPALQEPESISVIIKGVVRSCEFWGLGNREAAALFDVPIATWNRMKAGSFRGRLDQDKIMRASLIIGIYKGLRLLFNGPLAHGWPTASNNGPAFNGASPVKVMINGGIPAMLGVRRHIDALRGGS